ncbi:esterase/lipase family protein [Streptomyces olivoverticillatus]|uniref:esterase/lipase family protein n=1 Tax=Streptomyces olivoverticillatus TaxID=66427 RepID=UPI00160D767E|nr:alpha/beta fold hydrolase [Streptomyces olivoverticillatus]
MGALPCLGKLLRPCSLVRPSAALVRATVLELAILATHVLLYPAGLARERQAPPLPAAEAVPVPAGPPPVLLLHGFIDNRSVFFLLRRSLRRNGWRQVVCLNYPLLTRDVRIAAAALGRHVEEVCERTGQPQVDVVGHSLGGLVARYYIQRMGGDARVRTLVTLGTPHGGTLTAVLATVHPLARQMHPDSDVIAELAEPAPDCATHFISFWSELDLLMSPVETARIDHPDLVARSVRVSGVGHLALPVHGAVAAGIRQALTARVPEAGAPGAASVA